MNELITVTDCRDCPFRSCIHTGDIWGCNLVKMNGSPRHIWDWVIDGDIDEEKIPPVWCPLKKADFKAVRLEQ